MTTSKPHNVKEKEPVATAARPLDGIRILELGQLLAGPFAGTLLAYFGAEVIKVETPGTGDPVRSWRVVEDGTSHWWRSLSRNKRCMTLDLRKPEGRAIARQLAERSDVLIENFRPGKLEAWGLGPADLWQSRPELIFARVSGFGQTGPYAERPGYASVCEAYGGLRYVTGHPGEPPVRQNLSLGDSLTGLHAALGILLALFEQQRSGKKRGQVIDIAIFEAVYNMMESVVPDYARSGEMRGPSGSTISGVVPTNAYPTRDSEWVIIGGNGESIYKRLMNAAGRPDLADDPRLQSNPGRAAHQEEVDGALAAWTATLDREEVLRILAEAVVPAGPIYNVADMLADPHYRARELFEEVEVEGRPLVLPAILPHLSETPGRTDWPGPDLGAHSHEVLQDVLELGDDEIDRLVSAGVV